MQGARITRVAGSPPAGKTSFKRNKGVYQLALALWLGLSVGSVVLAGLNWVQLSRQLEKARQAYEVHMATTSILVSLLDSETAQRGYSITGEQEFLEPLTRAKGLLPGKFERLTALTKDDRATFAKVLALHEAADMVLARIDDAVTGRSRNSSWTFAETKKANAAVKEAMDKAREEVRLIHSNNPTLIVDDGSADRKQLLRASLTSLVAGFIGVITGIFAAWLGRVSLEQQQRENELIEAKLQAEHSSEEKSVFLANMSHEIRTPMNAIMGFGELLAGEITEPRQRRFLENIRLSAGALLQLINDILDMAKIEAGVLKLNPEPTDPREICNFVHAMFKDQAAKNDVGLHCVVAQDLPRALLLDRIRLRQILVNLVGNAVKFTHKGEIFIRVAWEKVESTSSQIILTIEVQDTGVGIPEDKLDAIFQPFVQSGAHRDLEKQGTGLGLSIVRRLTEAMGGTVTAASVLGQGSAFHLRLPNVHISARLPAADTAPTGAVVDLNQLRPSHFLVVDDNESNCELVAGLFAGTHHRLSFGHNGNEAISMARELKPDVIMLDIRMPGLDGREALAMIRKIPGMELTPIIAVTAARSALAPGEKDLRESFNGYVRKPFSKAELYAELAHFVPVVAKTDGTPVAPLEPMAPPPAGFTPATPELAAELKSILKNDWAGVAAGGAIDDAKAFAARLQLLAKTHSSPALAHYAQLLSVYAGQYAVESLEKLLADFPVLVAQLEGGPKT